ncbi:uncharacterized protein [Watersipora subatra]|uniref:uncharacterized protein n=1 Tax=Watersipora subatra TaxID=2589382 RepID=UPI00355C56C1
MISTTTIDSNMTVEPWYKKVDPQWLVQQVDISLKAASGKEIDYTKNWDFSGYSEYLNNMKRQTKRLPWYKQNYSTFMSNVDVETIEWKNIPKNGSLMDTPSSAEQRDIFSQLFELSEEDDSRNLLTDLD